MRQHLVEQHLLGPKSVRILQEYFPYPTLTADCLEGELGVIAEARRLDGPRGFGVICEVVVVPAGPTANTGLTFRTRKQKILLQYFILVFKISRFCMDNYLKVKHRVEATSVGHAEIK